MSEWIFSTFTLFGGLALFLYGMDVMGKGLEKVSGSGLEKILKKITDNPVKGVLLGALVTAVIQSSSATTVMVVGFVNSKLMSLSQAIGVIMGANIGTTITAWILSLSGIDSHNFWIRLLKPSSFSPIFAMIGIIMVMASKNGKKRDIGTILLGFAILMTGMQTMSASVSALSDHEGFRNLLVMFRNPLFGVLAGAVITAIIQSSSASVGILQALSTTKGITFGAAIPIIMGQNIGTCATALLSSIGANKNARRAAMAHLYFNIIGTVIFLIGYYSLDAIFTFTFADKAVDSMNIAIVHTLFNVISTIILLPFTKWLEKLATISVKDKSSRGSAIILDERLLATPAIAVNQSIATTVKMADIAKKNLYSSVGLLNGFNSKQAQSILDAEHKVDDFEDILGTYLVKLASRDLTMKDSNEVSMLLHCIGDFERISDHAVNILELATEMHEKKIVFSDDAKAEIEVMTNAVHDILELTVTAFSKEDVELAVKVEPLEQVIDYLKLELKNRHISRLQNGCCTIELGFIFSDLLVNLERVSDHCSNIAVSMIEAKQNSFHTHEYLKNLRSSDQTNFNRVFESYKLKYALPTQSN